jgi:hypothetical protein
MNTKTRDSLIELTNRIEQLATACVSIIGLQTCAEINQTCIDARYALRTDETITETGSVSN